MLLFVGPHGDEHLPEDGDDVTTWAKAPDFANDPERAAAVHEAARRDRERYLTAGLACVDCRFCHASVKVETGAPTPPCNGTPRRRDGAPYFAEVRFRRQQRAGALLPEAGRQHQTRCGGGRSGGSTQRTGARVMASSFAARGANFPELLPTRGSLCTLVRSEEPRGGECRPRLQPRTAP